MKGLLYETKLTTREIVSEAGKRKWADVLVHLLEGTRLGRRPKHGVDARPILVRGFGELFVDQIRVSHVDAWRAGVMAKLITPGHFSPTTCNGWNAILKVVMKAAVRAFELPRNPVEGMKCCRSRRSGEIASSRRPPRSGLGWRHLVVDRLDRKS